MVYRHHVYCLISLLLDATRCHLIPIAEGFPAVGALKLGIEQAENVESKKRVQALPPSRWVQYWDHCGA